VSTQIDVVNVRALTSDKWVKAHELEAIKNEIVDYPTDQCSKGNVIEVGGQTCGTVRAKFAKDISMWKISRARYMSPCVYVIIWICAKTASKTICAVSSTVLDQHRVRSVIYEIDWRGDRDRAS
jgi:hypothetical protein